MATLALDLAPYVASDSVVAVVGTCADASTLVCLAIAAQWVRVRDAKYEDGAVKCFGFGLQDRESCDRFRAVVPCAHLRPHIDDVALRDLMRQQRRRARACAGEPREPPVLVMLAGTQAAPFCNTDTGTDLVTAGRHLGVFTVVVLVGAQTALPPALSATVDCLIYVRAQARERPAACADALAPKADAAAGSGAPRVATLRVDRRKCPRVQVCINTPCRARGCTDAAGASDEQARDRAARL